MSFVTVMLVMPKDEMRSVERMRSELADAGIRLMPEKSFIEKEFKDKYKPGLILVYLTGSRDLDVEVCQKLVASQLAPVIAISSLPDEAYILAIFNTGVDDYLMKPIRMKELIARIRNILRRTQPALFNSLAETSQKAPAAQPPQNTVPAQPKTGAEKRTAMRGKIWKFCQRVENMMTNVFLGLYRILKFKKV